MKDPFGTRTAECEQCKVDYSNAAQTMEDVLLGDRDPGRWWCDEHETEFADQTREWARERLD